MDKSAVEEAVRAVMGAISDADGREMVGRRKPKDSPEGVRGDPPPCEGCSRGECSDPDHASEEDLEAMMGGDSDG